MDRLMECPICLERFDEKVRVPMLIPCQHTYCMQCLKTLVRGPNSIDCSLCRVNHSLRFEDVQKNRFILQFLETLRSNPNSNNNAPFNLPQNNPGLNNNNIPNLLPNLNQNHNQGQSGFNNAAKNNNNNSRREWDENRYLKEMFDEIDHNRDGKISANELHQALSKGQPNSQFDPVTVRIVLKKYDSDNDDEISFPEFFNLFIGLNNQYNEFLDFDADFSGSINNNEMINVLKRRGFNFTPQFYNFILSRFAGSNQQANISFDFFVRIIARFEHLKREFQSLQQNKNQPLNNNQLEQYIGQNFF